MATVYECEAWDTNRWDFVPVPWKGTKEACARAREGRGGKIHLETAEEVEDTKLDGEGRYYPLTAKG
jgi:hypothetical protein